MADLKAVLVSDGDNPVTGDIYVDPAGDCVVLEGTDEERQLQVAGLKTFLGEWFPDINQGVPYTTVLFGIKGPSKQRVEETIRKELMRRGTVATVSRMSTTFDFKSRTASVSWEVKLVSGGTVSAEVSLP